MSNRTVAEQRVSRLRRKYQAHQKMTDDIKEELIAAYRAREWIDFGFPNFDSYFQAKFSDVATIRLTRDEQRELNRELRDAGMSTRAVAVVTGVSHMTVKRDSVTGVTPSPPVGSAAMSPHIDDNKPDVSITSEEIRELKDPKKRSVDLRQLAVQQAKEDAERLSGRIVVAMDRLHWLWKTAKPEPHELLEMKNQLEKMQKLVDELRVDLLDSEMSGVLS